MGRPLVPEGVTMFLKKAVLRAAETTERSGKEGLDHRAWVP